MHSRRNIIFLCTRLADYFYQSICFMAKHKGYHVTIVRYRPDTNATYDFINTEHVTLIYQDEHDISPEWARQLDPAIIYVSGWVNPKYKKIAKAFRNSIPVVVGMDNPWKGNWKQYVHCFISFATVKPYFNKIWVAGPQQFAYASRLGFKFEDIIQGVYSADDEKYIDQHRVRSATGEAPTILFVGRLLEYKRPFMLAKVFNELQQQPEFRHWKLRIAGKGPLENKIRELNNSNIEIEGFLDPSKLPELYNSSTIFCLPSNGEHWGVVVHEAALCGLPLLLSDSVSAGSSLLIHGFNGKGFNTDDIDSLKKSMKELMSASPEEIRQMGLRSSLLAKQFSKDIWSQRFLSVIK